MPEPTRTTSRTTIRSFRNNNSNRNNSSKYLKIQNILIFVFVNQLLAVTLFHHVSLLLHDDDHNHDGYGCGTSITNNGVQQRQQRYRSRVHNRTKLQMILDAEHLDQQNQKRHEEEEQQQQQQRKEPPIIFDLEKLSQYVDINQKEKNEPLLSPSAEEEPPMHQYNTNTNTNLNPNTKNKKNKSLSTKEKPTSRSKSESESKFRSKSKSRSKSEDSIDDGLTIPGNSSREEKEEPSSDSNDSDDGNNIPRLFMNLTLWANDPNLLEALTLTEKLAHGGRIVTYVTKRLCSFHNKDDAGEALPLLLPSCPTTNTNSRSSSPSWSLSSSSCAYHFWDDNGNCFRPQHVIDPKFFWRRVPEQWVVFQNTTARNTATATTTNASDSYFALTSWDMIAEGHQPLDTDYNSKSNTRVSTKPCEGKNHSDRPCPPPCNFEFDNENEIGQKENENGQNYNIFWDTLDNLCKQRESNLPWMDGSCSCYNTCYTQAATLFNTSWPWPNETARQAIYGSTPTNKRRTPHEQWTFAKEQRHRLSERWEMPPNQYFRESSTCDHVVDGVIDEGLSLGLGHQPNNGKLSNTTTATRTRTTPPSFRLSNVAHASGSHHLYFIPQAKLIFCGIPKVGISEWIKFFRKTFGAQDYLSMPYFKRDTTEFQVSNLPPDMAERLWNDPSWTKAVIFRDPAERLLSAYLDKIVRQSFTQRYFHIGHLSDDPRQVLEFEEFVHLVTNTSHVDSSDPRGIHYHMDPHWRPQLFMCGMDHLLPLYDFVGSFDQLAEHTRLLLERVGLWESHGASFAADAASTTTTTNATNALASATTTTTTDASTNNRGLCYITPPNQSEPLLGFNQKAPTGSRHSSLHGTGSREKMDQYYTSKAVIDSVRKAYAMDYAIWDDIQERAKVSPLNVASGRDLKFVQESCAKNKK